MPSSAQELGPSNATAEEGREPLNVDRDQEFVGAGGRAEGAEPGQGTQAEQGGAKRRKTDHGKVGSDTDDRNSYSVALPLDLWLMIGEHLEPLELLQLTRVDKSLRQLFTSKRDAHRIWKLAFKNAEFPTLVATDWDLISLTSLMHDPSSCIACGKPAGIVSADFALRMLGHAGCLTRTFTAPDEILEEIEQVHPDTLACVTSLRYKPSRKVEERYVASQVIKMNTYLNYLDSTTFASRDRNVRKAAREARDAYIAKRKQTVEARFEDETKIESWLKIDRDRRLRAEAARKPTRTEELAEIAHSPRAKKIAYAQQLSLALSHARRPLPSQVVDSLFPPREDRPTPVKWEVHLDSVSADDAETACSISNGELDNLLARFSSSVLGLCG